MSVSTQAPQSLDAPQWNLISEYPSFESPEFSEDFQKVTAGIQRMAQESAVFKGHLESPSLSPQDADTLLEKAAHIFEQEKSLVVILQNLLTYAMLHLSTCSQNMTAQKSLEKLKKEAARMEQATQPMYLFLMKAPEAIFEAFLQQEAVADSQFKLKYRRQLQHHRFLSLAEENLLSSLSVAGHDAWGELYQQMTGAMKAEFESLDGQVSVRSFSEMYAMLGDRNEELRKRAYHTIKDMFHTQDETCAAILNALADWRLEMNRRRSHTVPTHFLTTPLHSNRITQKTLDAMMNSVRKHKSLGQKVLKLQALFIDKEKLAPWDINGSAPALGERNMEVPFAQAIEHISGAFRDISPDMADFVQMMVKNQWVDAAPSPGRRAGAFCAGFKKSREPRVFMTYLGSTVDQVVLAHELGHAFHSWVMRDMPLSQTGYPMTLAETASTFGEQTFRSYLLGQATSPEEKFDILWQEVSSIPRFTVNLPLRYDFEKSFYEQRPQGALGPDEFRALLDQTWEEWYGDSVSEPDSMFWATKMHFYLAHPSFYNFPYIFGYLFSQGIYAEKAKRGEQFYPFYTDLLRDTGRMTAEDLVQKHLNMNLEEPEFWEQCFGILENYVTQFEAVVAELKQP